MGWELREGAGGVAAADQRPRPEAALHTVGDLGDRLNTPQGNRGPGGQRDTVHFPTGVTQVWIHVFPSPTEKLL